MITVSRKIREKRLVNKYSELKNRKELSSLF